MGTRAFLASLVLHSTLAAALGVVPLFSDEALPERAAAVTDVVGPILSLPPPPPARGDVRVGRTTGPRKSDADSRLVPPTAIPEATNAPDSAPADEAFGSDVIGDLDGSRDGVIGGVMDDLPTSAPPPPPRVVRINAGLLAPRLVRRVEPGYPPLAAAARVTASVVLEAEVDARGQVARVSVVHGHPLFDEAAVEAVRQWRYQPLLLSGEPTAFILTVTVRFELDHSTRNR
jgi:periplasmic protein TonB